MGWTRFSAAADFPFFLDREPLLSSFPANPTVGGLRGEKEKCSTQSRLRGDPGFVEFPQTPRGRISPYLGFIPIFSVFRMFDSIEAIRGRWIGPKTWDRINTIFFKPNGAAVATPRLCGYENGV